VDDESLLVEVDHQLGSARVVFVLDQLAQYVRRGVAEREFVEHACGHAELKVQACRISWDSE
jgi:hypothetical protein